MADYLEEAVADGSMFGWLSGDEITALILIEIDPQPRFTVMPRIGTSPGQWPPFTEATVFDAFLEYYGTSEIIDLAPLAGSTQRYIFWSERQVPVVAGAGIIAVKAALSPDPARWVLPSGVYVFSAALRAGASTPSLAEVLADPGKTDLGPQFRDFTTTRGATAGMNTTGVIR